MQSKKAFYTDILTKSSHRRYTIKQGALKNFAKINSKTPMSESLFIKKKDSDKGVFL